MCLYAHFIIFQQEEEDDDYDEWIEEEKKIYILKSDVMHSAQKTYFLRLKLIYFGKNEIKNTWKTFQ